jgi:hypothetical protein
VTRCSAGSCLWDETGRLLLADGLRNNSSEPQRRLRMLTTAGTLSMQYSEQMWGLLVINHGLKLVVEYCPGCRSIKLQWFDPVYAGPCIPTASASCSGYYFSQLSRTPGVWFPGCTESPLCLIPLPCSSILTPHKCSGPAALQLLWCSYTVCLVSFFFQTRPGQTRWYWYQHLLYLAWHLDVRSILNRTSDTNRNGYQWLNCSGFLKLIYSSYYCYN